MYQPLIKRSNWMCKTYRQEQPWTWVFRSEWLHLWWKNSYDHFPGLNEEIMNPGNSPLLQLAAEPMLFSALHIANFANSRAYSLSPVTIETHSHRVVFTSSSSNKGAHVCVSGFDFRRTKFYSRVDTKQTQKVCAYGSFSNSILNGSLITTFSNSRSLCYSGRLTTTGVDFPWKRWM